MTEIFRNYFDINDYNNTNVPLQIKTELESIPFDEKQFLKYHQFIVKEYFTRFTGARGILICHGVGRGKTPLAVSLTNYCRELDPERKIIALLPKSLEPNFKNNIHKYLDKQFSEKEINEIIQKDYKFISLNASNMFQQIYNVDKSKEEFEYEKKIGLLLNDIYKRSSLENSFLIIDEAHNLFNSITNGSKNAVALYDLIMKTKNIKLLFLTGTPIVNDPFELVPCFNMLRGYIDFSKQLKIGGGEDGDSDDGEAVGDNDNDNDYNGHNNDHNNDHDNDHDNDRDNTDNSGYESDDNNDGNDDNDDNGSNSGDDNNANNNTKTIPDIVKGPKSKDKKQFKKFGKNKESENQTTLFSELYYEFEDFFIDDKKKCIKNKDKFENRIYGLLSYYGDIYFEDKKNKSDFPEELPVIVETIPMSSTQYARYAVARDLEREESKSGFKGKEGRFSATSGGSSSYRVKSRQISNFCIPEYALGPAVGKKARPKYIDRIRDEDLSQDLGKYSPKMLKMLSNINKHSNQPGIVYSQFVSGEGLSVLARILEVNGWENYLNKETQIKSNIADYMPQIEQVENKIGGGQKEKIKNTGKTANKTAHNPANKTAHNKSTQDKPFNIKDLVPGTFAVISGDIPLEMRQHIISQFNNKANRNGSIIRLLLLSGAVAEGIDLKGGRHGHITEPFWNEARIDQVKGRIIRYKSHDDLPESERNVQFYIYLSDYPEEVPQNKRIELTTDIELYKKSSINKKIINTFMYALAEASFDCPMHHKHLSKDLQEKIECKLCVPDNQILYHPNINKDMQYPNLCKKITDTKIKVNEIKIDGEKYYYKKDNFGNINIYEFDKKYNKHVPMPQYKKNYPIILEKILES